MSPWIVLLRLAEVLLDRIDGLKAVRQRVKYIQEYYQRRDEKVEALYNRSYIHLSEDEIDRFVDESARRLFRIYQYLWVQHGAAGGFDSALDLAID